MFGIIKKMFIVLLACIVNASNHTKCVYLKPTLINLHPNEYRHEFHYYPFMPKLDRWVTSCNTLNHLSNKVCVSNKIEDLNQHDYRH